MSRLQTGYEENRTFSLAPVQFDDLILQTALPEDSDIKSSSKKKKSRGHCLADSPENAECIHTQVERLREHIEFHAISRIDLFFYTLIAYWGTRLIVDMGETKSQHGVCDKTKKLGMFFHACHSSLFPNLVDGMTREELAAPLPSMRTGILHGKYFFDALNVTVALPQVVNQLDIQLEGKRSDDDPLRRPIYRRRALEIINLVSNDEMNPIEGMTQFLNMLHGFYQDKRAYINESAKTSPTKARKRAWQYSGNAILSLRGDTYVRRDYIEMLLRPNKTDRPFLLENPDRCSEIYLKRFKEIAEEILGSVKFKEIKRNIQFSKFDTDEKGVSKVIRELAFDFKEDPFATPKKPVKTVVDPKAINIHLNNEIKKNNGLLSSLKTLRTTLIKKLEQGGSAKIEKSLEQVDQQIVSLEKDIVTLQEKLAENAEILPKMDDLKLSRSNQIMIELSLEDHARLWGFDCKETGAGGDCFFHALLDQLRRNAPTLITVEATHLTLREMAFDYILEHIAEFSGAIAGPVHNYILGNIGVGAWASHHEIYALANSLQLSLVIVRSDHSITVFRHPHSQATVYLAFTPEIHYQSLVKNHELSAKADIETLIRATPIGQWANHPIPQSFIPVLPVQTPNSLVKSPQSPQSPSVLLQSNERIYGLLTEMKRQIAFLTGKMQALSIEQSGDIKELQLPDDPLTTPLKLTKTPSKAFAKTGATPTGGLKQAHQMMGKSATEMLGLIPISSSGTPRGYLAVGSGYKMQTDLFEIQRITSGIVENIADDAIVLNHSPELIRMLPNQAIVINPILLVYCHLKQSIHHNWDILNIIFQYHLDEWYDLFITPQFDAKRCGVIKDNAVVLTSQTVAYFVLNGKIVMKNGAPQAIIMTGDSKLETIPEAKTGEFRRIETSETVAKIVKNARTLGGHAAIEYTKSDMEDGIKILQNIGYLAFDEHHTILRQLQRQMEEIESVMTESPVSPTAPDVASQRGVGTTPIFALPSDSLVAKVLNYLKKPDATEEKNWKKSQNPFLFSCCMRFVNKDWQELREAINQLGLPPEDPRHRFIRVMREEIDLVGSPSMLTLANT